MERQQEKFSKDPTQARRTTANVVFMPLLVLIKHLSTILWGKYILCVIVYGMSLISTCRFWNSLLRRDEPRKLGSRRKRYSALHPTADGAARRVCRETSSLAAPWLHAWLVWFWPELQLDVMWLLWANLGRIRYNFIFTTLLYKVKNSM